MNVLLTRNEKKLVALHKLRKLLHAGEIRTCSMFGFTVYILLCNLHESCGLRRTFSVLFYPVSFFPSSVFPYVMEKLYL